MVLIYRSFFKVRNRDQIEFQVTDMLVILFSIDKKYESQSEVYNLGAQSHVAVFKYTSDVLPCGRNALLV